MPVPRALDFDGTIVPADKVHAAMMSALAFFYGEVISADDFVAR